MGVTTEGGALGVVGLTGVCSATSPPNSVLGTNRVLEVVDDVVVLVVVVVVVLEVVARVADEGIITEGGL